MMDHLDDGLREILLLLSLFVTVCVSNQIIKRKDAPETRAWFHIHCTLPLIFIFTPVLFLAGLKVGNKCTIDYYWVLYSGLTVFLAALFTTSAQDLRQKASNLPSTLQAEVNASTALLQALATLFFILYALPIPLEFSGWLNNPDGEGVKEILVSFVILSAFALWTVPMGMKIKIEHELKASRKSRSKLTVTAHPCVNKNN